jgi:hypothetical protein
MPDLNDSSIRTIYVGWTLPSALRLPAGQDLSVAFDVVFGFIVLTFGSEVLSRVQNQGQKLTGKSVRPTPAITTNCGCPFSDPRRHVTFGARTASQGLPF